MKLITIAMAVASLLIGAAAGGYGAGYFMYGPQIKSFEALVRSYKMQVSDLTSEVARISQTVTNQEGRISALASDKSRLESNLAKAEEAVVGYEKEMANLKSQISDEPARLNRILGITVTQHYDWSYQGAAWKWDLSIPLSLYVEYLERPRPIRVASWVDMAKDPKDDPIIDRLTQRINEASTKRGFAELQKVNFVVAFVQGLPYTVDVVTTPYNEYPRYPVETLFDRGGDCEDTSILVAALLDKMGYDVALLALRNARHMAVGVSLSAASGSYYEYQGKKYYYVETTGSGWGIGQIPSSITDRSANVYPLKG